jgi:hypothetical protein
MLTAKRCPGRHAFWRERHEKLIARWIVMRITAAIIHGRYGGQSFGGVFQRLASLVGSTGGGNTLIFE